MTDLFSQPEFLELETSALVSKAKELFAGLSQLQIQSRVHAINEIRVALHAYSPFKDEPVDCVQWIQAEDVGANDYNPNSVAPPEMKLLEHSITEDGYTQPIVAWKNGDAFEVVDGFHRHRVGRESAIVKARVYGYLPLAIINDSRLDRSDRIAATIRHNRARGKHKVEAMSDIWICCVIPPDIIHVPIIERIHIIKIVYDFGCIAFSAVHSFVPYRNCAETV